MSNIPKYRPEGSPLAARYGATNHDGTPVAVKVQKQQTRKPQRPPAHDGLSPNERAGIGRRSPADTNQAQALRNLRAAFSPPSPRRRVAKAKGDPMMAVFDANGTLMGVIDPADLNPLASGTPAAPAAPAKPTAVTAPEPVVVDPATGDPVTAAVAKAMRRRPVARQRVAKQLAQQSRRTPAAQRVIKSQKSPDMVFRVIQAGNQGMRHGNRGGR